MSQALLLIGPSAVGKTAVTRRLVPLLSAHRKVAVIHGDFLSHVTHPFDGSDEDLDLKYELMIAALRPIIARRRWVVINDFVRRVRDSERVVAFLRREFYDVTTVRLMATPKILAQRNRCRDPLDFVPEIPFSVVAREDASMLVSGAVPLDTSNLTVEETVSVVLNLFLQAGGV